MMSRAALSSLEQTLERQIFPDTGHAIAIHTNDRLPYIFQAFFTWATEFKAQITTFYPKLLDEEEKGLIILPQDIVTLQEIHEEVQKNFRKFEDLIRESAYQEVDHAERCTSDVVCPMRKFQRWLTCFQPLTAHLDFFVGRLNELERETELKSLVHEVKKIKTEEKAQNVKPAVPSLDTASSSTCEIRGENIVLGIEEEVQKIKHLVLGEPSSRLEIISIVGMGGIGKTTLARTIYRDSAVSRHFDVRTWITVSQIYDARAVLLSLLNSGKDENQQLSNEELVTKVYRSLKFRRYLIIVDDIWNTHVWDDIKNKLLPDECNGSRVVITTRQTDVAVYADSYVCNVPLMDKDTSWNLLQKKVFRGDSCPLELADIGINIAGKCHGLPLTIVVIAGLLLQVNQTRASWENIANDVKSAVHKNDEHHVMDILSLSYNYLPDWLQPCLLYLGRFPEDQKISVSNLIKLWVAEGFLKPKGGNNLEETGYEYMEDLISRNLVSADRKRRNGRPNKCSVHDLIREMCIKLSQGMFNPRDILFLSVSKSLYFADQSQNLEEGYESLRVLDTTLEEKVEFPYPVSQLCELLQLKYLSLHFLVDYFLKIPTNICVLTNLQTLVIQSKDDFSVYLPHEILEIPELRHLIVGASGFLDHVESESEAALPLVNLETLFHIQIDNTNAGILKRIPNIRKLGFEINYGSMHFIEHLIHLHHLENLNLKITLAEDYHWRDSIFPISLRKLTMKDVKLPWDYMSRICGSLPNLEVLKLREDACRGPVWETQEGDFLSLKMLELEDSTLKMWIVESSSHFPRLEHVRLSYCKRLEVLPWCMGEVDTIQLIEVTNSSTNADEWAKAILEQQQDEGNESFQLGRSVPESGKQTWVEDWARARLVAELANNGMFRVNLMGKRME